MSPISLAINNIWTIFFFCISGGFYERGYAEYMSKIAVPFFVLYLIYPDIIHPIFVHAYSAQSEQRRIHNENHPLFNKWYWMSIFPFGMVGGFCAGAFKVTLLQSDWALLLLNSTLWIPQIVHSYRKRSRKGPPVHFCAALFAI